MQMWVLRRALVTVLFAGLVANPLVRAQPQPDFGRTGAQQQVLELIGRIEAESGPNDSALIEPLSGLALLYRESDDHLRSSAALGRAIDLVRIHYGLHSLEQAPLIRRLVENELAAGNVESAWDLEEELLALAERHRDEIAAARILRETGDRRMEILRRYDAGEFPREIVLGCYYSAGRLFPAADGFGRQNERECASGSRNAARRALRSQVQNFYGEAINIILRTGHYADPEIPALLMDIARSSSLYGNAGLGRRSLEYLLVFRTTNSESWRARIEALVLIADWDLVYSAVGGRDFLESALSGYQDAHRLAVTAGLSRETIDEIFAPAVPVVLPSIVPNALESAESATAIGFVDVSFVVRRNGKAERISVARSSPGVTRARERGLIRSLKGSRFRPFLEDGEAAESGPLVVRYYLRD